jgi:hypothetical protein
MIRDQQCPTMAVDSTRSVTLARCGRSGWRQTSLAVKKSN